MVDFRKLREERKIADPINPYDIFKRLAPEGINDLWHSQQVILNEWFNRRNESDLILKLATGGGKTIIGLLIAQSIINETKESVLYLCPTTQLAVQTENKAKSYGINVIRYIPGKGIPIGFRSGSCIMIATYNAIFNGLSKFGIEGDLDTISVGGIIFDDAHMSESIIRDAFTIKIPYSEDDELYDEFIGMFREDFAKIDRIAIFDDIVDGKDSKVLEVPYWAWNTKGEQVRELLKDNSDKIIFQWKLLRDNLKYCHCLISSDEVSITPIYPLVSMFPTFNGCKRRIYMSATLANDSTIIRTFDADVNSVLKPIQSNSNISLGERMILAPALMNLNNDVNIRELVKMLSEKISKDYGTIILTPSSYSAKEWDNIGEYADSSELVLEQVDRMTNNKEKGPFVWANRYDGIDLPADTCRLLIMSGKPAVMNCYDRYIATILNGSELINSIIAQRIEQGIGRATRGAGDYCVIIFEGDELVTWISESSNLNLLTPSTKAQMEIGNLISKEIKDPVELLETITMCYSRNSDWTSLHAEMLADISSEKVSYEESIKEAALERKFFNNYINGNPRLAKGELNELIASVKDVKYKSWLLQLLARIEYSLGETVQSTSTQKQAYELNNQLFKPNTEIRYEYLKEPSNQAKMVVDNLNKYSYKRAIISELTNITSKLNSNSSANQFEDSMERLGKIIGFESQRPEHEYGEGPDVLWRLTTDKFVIIECKSKKKIENPLNKKEHGQLLESYEWFREKYPEYEAIKVSLHPTDFATNGAHTNNTLVFTMPSLIKFTTNIKNLFDKLMQAELEVHDMYKLCDTYLKEYKLSSEFLEAEYFVKFRCHK